MRLTLFEIETTIRKACTGAGFLHGLSEDIGEAAAWLVSRNFDGVEAALISIRSGIRKSETQFGDNGVIIFSNPQISVCGPSVIDLLIGEPSCTEIQLQNPDAIELLFGLAGVAARYCGSDFQFEFSNGTRVLISADKIKMNGVLPGASCELVIITCRTKQENLDISNPLEGVEVDDEIWHEIIKLAAKTYVPESKASRVAGAGAGLSDND